MNITIHSSLGIFALFAVLTFPPMSQAQDLPADSIQISPSQAAALNVGRLYRLSSWQPDSPPLPPPVLFQIIGSGEDGFDSATNCAIYFSASAQRYSLTIAPL